MTGFCGQVFDSKSCIWGERNKHVFECHITHALEKLSTYSSTYKKDDDGRIKLDILSRRMQLDLLELSLIHI